MGDGEKPTGWLEPAMADSVRDDYVVLTARHMRSQAQLMFTGFIASLPLVVYVGSDGAQWPVRLGLPLLILCLSLAGLWVVRPTITEQTAPQAARSMIGRAWTLCALTAAFGGIWALLSWSAAPAETKVYYPAIMSLGALTLGYCLTAVRAVGVTTLLLALVPTGVALALTGDPMNLALVGAMVIAIGFQVVMMKRHQDLLLMLVEERHRSRELARVDPLTGLPNRRALLEHFAKLAELDNNVRLMVIDIDRFKTVNDRFGHDMGDSVLRQFALIFSGHARGTIHAARLGGEEFALLGPADALDPALALRLLEEIRNHAMPHGHQVTASMGIADMPVHSSSDWNRLYGRADKALYRAKRGGRNGVVIDNVANDSARYSDPALSQALKRG